MFSDPEQNIEQFGLKKGDCVADFGAGTGFYSFAAAEAVGESGKVYSIDVQKDLLQKFKNEARNVRHLSNVEIVWGDLENLGGTRLRDNSLDAVIVANVFFQLEKKDNTCLEIKRILKKDGRVLFVDWSSSFGGMGPQSSDIFYPEKAEEIFIKHGFIKDGEIDSGAHHYGLIFKNK
ncbi:MAG: methyltransferase domain-containing protein [Candidatus Paceibacterota bacterium]